ncbi:hypothetical protein ISCGN_023383 [Ixodes scapularis]
MLTDAPQATASTLRPPVLQLPDAEMALEVNVAVTMEDEVWKTVTRSASRPSRSSYDWRGCRGVIRVRPEHTLEYLQQHLRCESATILDMRILGKTGMLLLTFNAPELPPRLVLDFEVVHVYPYRPKLVACYNCHGLGHIARFCPAETVCRDCGRRHPTTESCEEEPFCAACCVPGHLSLNSACPSRLLKSKPPTPRTPPEKRNVTWAEVSAPPPPKPASSLPPEILQMMNDMRQENKRLHEENKWLHDQMEQVLAHLKVMGVPTPAPDVNKATQPAPGAGSRSRAHSRSRSRDSWECKKRNIAPLLLHVAGEEAQEVYSTFQLGEQATYAEVVARFENYCTPKKNEAYERYVFRTRIQAEDTTDCFLFHNPVVMPLCGIPFLAQPSALSTTEPAADPATESAQAPVERVVNYLLAIAPSVIKFPADLDSLASDFEEVSGIPGVIGCIDGTYINFRCPDEKIPATYVNRHEALSLTLQGVCDDKGRFIDAFTGVSSRIHDARVFDLSDLSERLPTLCRRGKFHILGDAAYPSREYLVTPFKDYVKMTREQRDFNRDFSATRVTIENSFQVAFHFF